MSRKLVNPVKISDSTDLTKLASIDPSGATTGTEATITTAQIVNRTYAIPDSGASAQFLMSEGSQTINGTKTFKTSIKIQETSGTDNITIQAPALAAGYTLTLPVDDGTSNNEVLTTDGSGVLSWQSFLPAGMLLPFAGSSTPSGFLLCDGSVVSQATYANLFAAIGSTWDTGGEGAGNFRLPSLSRRTLVGSGGAGSATLGNAVGNTGGEESHTLITAELASHNHAATGLTASSVVTDPQHAHGVGTITVATDGAHPHNVLIRTSGGTGNAGVDAATRTRLDENFTSNDGANNQVHSGTSQTGTFSDGGDTYTNDGSHTHGLSGNTGSDSTGITVATSVGGSTASTGSGTAHNNIQPSAVVTYVIKY